MLKRINSAMISILACALAVSALQGEWIKVSPVGAGFSVLMPAKPAEETKSSDDFTPHLFSLTTDNVIYLAGYGEYATGIKLSADTELALNRDKFLKGLNANLLASKPISLDGRSGLEFTGESE